MKRKDIENLKIILKSIEAVEKSSASGSVLAAERLDCLFTALRVQANAVVETEVMEELTDAIIN